MNNYRITTFFQSTGQSVGQRATRNVDTRQYNLFTSSSYYSTTIIEGEILNYNNLNCGIVSPGILALCIVRKPSFHIIS